jgi:hypothetical protein
MFLFIIHNDIFAPGDAWGKNFYRSFWIVEG